MDQPHPGLPQGRRNVRLHQWRAARRPDQEPLRICREERHRVRHQDAARRARDHADDGGGARRHGERLNRRRLHGLPHSHKGRWHLAHHRQGLSHVRRVKTAETIYNNRKYSKYT